MSSDLAVVGSFRGLSAASSGGFRFKDMTIVGVPRGGGTTWQWKTILGDRFEREITGVIVALSDVQIDLWPIKGKAQKGTIPYMRSLDGQKAYIIGDDSGDLDVGHIEAAANGDGSYDCAKIKYFQWEGQGKGSKPPRADATSVVGILMAGESSPVFIRLSKTSSPKVQDFCGKLRAAGCEPYEAVVSLSLEAINGANATYSVVVPKFVEKAPAEGVPSFRAYFEAVSPMLRGSTEKRTKEQVASSIDADSVPF